MSHFTGGVEVLRSFGKRDRKNSQFSRDAPITQAVAAGTLILSINRVSL